VENDRVPDIRSGHGEEGDIVMNTANGLRAWVVYESMFGNTVSVAQALAAGLRAEGFDTLVSDVSAAPQGDGRQLLVVGAPTHAFSLSRASTRRDAVRQGARPEAAKTGIREWVGALVKPIEQGRLAAAFDTRARKVKHVPATASRKAGRLLVRKGYDLVVPPRGFLVEDVSGPLTAGQLAEATEWGRELGAAARTRLCVTAGHQA
jgi:hypothetical protein